jgi:hypothetical protein
MVQQHERAVLLAQEFFGYTSFTALILANRPLPRVCEHVRHLQYQRSFPPCHLWLEAAFVEAAA